MGPRATDETVRSATGDLDVVLLGGAVPRCRAQLERVGAALPDDRARLVLAADSRALVRHPARFRNHRGAEDCASVPGHQHLERRDAGPAARAPRDSLLRLRGHAVRSASDHRRYHRPGPGRVRETGGRPDAPRARGLPARSERAPRAGVDEPRRHGRHARRDRELPDLPAKLGAGCRLPARPDGLAGLPLRSGVHLRSAHADVREKPQRDARLRRRAPCLGRRRHARDRDSHAACGSFSTRSRRGTSDGRRASSSPRSISGSRSTPSARSHHRHSLPLRHPGESRQA